MRGGEEKPPDTLLILINYLYENEVSVVIGKRLLEKQVSLPGVTEGLKNVFKPERGPEQASVRVCERDYLEDHNTEAKTPVNL